MFWSLWFLLSTSPVSSLHVGKKINRHFKYEPTTLPERKWNIHHAPISHNIITTCWVLCTFPSGCRWTTEGLLWDLNWDQWCSPGHMAYTHLIFTLTVQHEDWPANQRQNRAVHKVNKGHRQIKRQLANFERFSRNKSGQLWRKAETYTHFSRKHDTTDQDVTSFQFSRPSNWLLGFNNHYSFVSDCIQWSWTRDLQVESLMFQMQQEELEDEQVTGPKLDTHVACDVRLMAHVTVACTWVIEETAPWWYPQVLPRWATPTWSIRSDPCPLLWNAYEPLSVLLIDTPLSTY